MLINLQATIDFFFLLLAIDAAIVSNIEFEGLFAWIFLRGLKAAGSPNGR